MRAPFVTGFGPFDATDDNPSAWLASDCGAQFEVLKVTFAAVDEFLGSLAVASCSGLLLLGYANREKMSIELIARNQIGPHADVDGIMQGPSPIDPVAPRQLSGGLWPGVLDSLRGVDELEESIDAGDYLCNYIYFRSLRQWPHLPIGFLHVPSFDIIARERQLEIVRQILTECASTVG